jgi:molecular chaperone DnaK
VLSTNGDTFLGGEDFDQRVIDYIVTEFKKEAGVDLKNDVLALQRLKEAAEKAKIELSSAQETDVNLPFITADAAGPKHLNLRLTRPRLEQLVDDLIQRSVGPCRQALKDSGLKAEEIDEVVLVGGQTRMPAIQKIVKDFFGKEPNKGVNPDEVVAVGAAVQAGVLSGDVKDLVLLDVTPLSLGVETLGGVMTPMIPRNTTIPTQKKEVFSTATDSQPSVEVHVLQGERTEARYNRTLGRFHLEGIMPAPRGVPKIEVTFDIDANGILSVHAKDMATGKDQRITITASGGLKEDEIQRLVKEAGEHEAEDKKRREEIERRNKLDNLCYTLEKTIADNKDKIPESDAAALTTAVAEARKAIEKQDDAAVAAATEKLEKEAHRIASVMYEKVGPQGGAPPPGADGGAPPPPAGGGKGKDGVIDAEFEESN